MPLLDANIAVVDLLFQLNSFRFTCIHFELKLERNKERESLLLLRTVTEGSLGEASRVVAESQCTNFMAVGPEVFARVGVAFVFISTSL